MKSKPIKALLKFPAKLMRIFNARANIILILLAVAVATAVTYGIVAYQTRYGCDSTGVATGSEIDWKVLAKPCIYIYFTGIAGGSAVVILLIPVPEKSVKAGKATI